MQLLIAAAVGALAGLAGAAAIVGFTHYALLRAFRKLEADYEDTLDRLNTTLGRVSRLKGWEQASGDSSNPLRGPKIPTQPGPAQAVTRDDLLAQARLKGLVS